MSARKKKPVNQLPETPQAKAVRLHTEIGGCEDSCAPLYGDLGETLTKIGEEEKYKRTKLVAYATDVLDLRPSRVWRALRIYDRFKDNPTGLNGLTVYEAMGNDRKKPEPVEPLPLKSPLSVRECRIAQRFTQQIGSKERAEEVAKRYFVDHEEPPSTVKAKKGKAKRGKLTVDPKIAEVSKLITPKRRSEFRRNAAKLWGDYRGGIDPILSAIQARASTGEGEKSLQELTSDACLFSRKFLTDQWSRAVSHDPVAAVAGMQDLMNEALAPADAETVTTAG